jgi:Domain of unknown function (DUF5666)
VNNMTVNRIAAGAALGCAVMLVAACGGGTSATGNAAAAPTSAASGNGAAGGARGFPGATGLLAQIDGKTLQVQSTAAQTAVTYSASTTFTDTVAAKLSDVVVGVCVQARSARPAAGAGGAAPTTAPRAPSAPIVAATVEISAPVNGKCSAQGGFRMGGARPPGAAGAPTRVAGVPGSGRTRAPGTGGGFGGLGAFGKVTAVNGSGFTIESSRPQNGTASTAAPTSETVQTPAGTKYTRTGAASAKALVVGVCVTALGKADDTGAIAATSILLRPAENGSCSSGFGGGSAGRGAGGSPAPAGGSAGA